MANSLVKSRSKSPMQLHLEAVERAREMYLAAIKRAEADYFERIKRATEAVSGDHEVANGQAPQQQPEAQASVAA